MKPAIVFASALFGSGALVAALGLAVGATACDGTSGFACDCFPCTSAITLNVVDRDGNPVGGDWSAEASIDGDTVNTQACDPEFRNGVNTCSFGFTPGVYEIVVRSPFEEKELTGRFAGRVGQDCCNCLTGETIPVVLATE